MNTDTAEENQSYLLSATRIKNMIQDEIFREIPKIKYLMPYLEFQHMKQEDDNRHCYSDKAPPSYMSPHLLGNLEDKKIPTISTTFYWYSVFKITSA